MAKDRKAAGKPKPAPKDGQAANKAAAAASPGAASGRRGRAPAPDRKQAILDAALEEFAARGYAATRLDDVAKRAGVAKGTIYLYFADKETLFQELLRSMLIPVIGTLSTVPDLKLPMRAIAERLLGTFIQQIYATRRRDVVRLMLTEGHLFPELAEFYYREVLSKALAGVKAVLARAAEPGNARHAALVEFPQLLIAPGVVAVLWSGLFERFSPLDIQRLMRAHLDLLFGGDTGRAS